MSRRRAYTEETLGIIGRFFEAFDALVESRTIRGFQTYCRLWGIDKRHFYAQREDTGRGYFEVSWLLPMIREYHVSPDWLLFGKGSMFRKPKGAT